MNRIVLRVLPLVALLASSGCIAVSAKNNRFGPECEAVVVQDRLYVVNTSTGNVGEIDLSTARPFRPAPAEAGSNCD